MSRSSLAIRQLYHVLGTKPTYLITLSAQLTLLHERQHFNFSLSIANSQRDYYLASVQASSIVYFLFVMTIVREVQNDKSI
jgi:hypothetical protein